MERGDRQCRAMVFAAGLGTRLKPITNTLPKALVSYDGEPLLRRILLRLKDFGFQNVVINIHHFSNLVREYVAQNNGFGLQIAFSDESDLLRDTGGGIKYARPLLGDEPFLVHNVDIVSNLDLDWFYNQHSSDSVATLLVSDRETSRYFLFNDENRLVGWINQSTGEVKSPFDTISTKSCVELTKSYKRLAFGGVHVISPTLLPLMDSWPDKFSIVDFYLSIAANYQIKGVVAPQCTKLVDVGKLSQLK